SRYAATYHLYTLSYTTLFRSIGPRVVPRSSPLFQEFKIWQTLNNVRVRIKKDGLQFTEKNDLVKRKDYPNEKEYFLDLTAKQLLFEELNLKGNLSANRIIEILGYKPSQIEINFKQLEGNRTNQALFNAYLKILEVEGYDEALLKLSDKDEI